MNYIAKRPIVLCFADYYLPGYRAGGPVRSISNFVDCFGDEYDIRIVTRDRDFMNPDSYPGIRIDNWNRIGKARVFYASRRFLSFFGVLKLLRGTTHDVLYLNSFFSYRFTTLPLVVRKLGLTSKQPCLIATRGELSTGALFLNAAKKSLYLAIVRALGLYTRLHWQASSEFECADIRRVMGAVSSSVFIVPDLPPIELSPDTLGFTSRFTAKSDSPLRIIFLSRISPQKNLHFLLKSLCSARERIELAIYGPLEDLGYWKRCQALISKLPLNISVEYRGEIDASHVIEIFSGFELFVFPTFGENYGHVVLESLTSGTPVLISDQTPWDPSPDGAVSILPLADPLYWSETLDRYARLSADERLRLKSLASNYAKKYLQDCNVVQKTRHLFGSLFL